MLLLMNDKSLAHSHKDLTFSNFLKLANAETKLMLDKLQVNKNAALYITLYCATTTQPWRAKAQLADAM